MTGKQLSDREKAEIIFKQSSDEFEKLAKEFWEVYDAFTNLQSTFKCAATLMKRSLNEEKNNGNIHKDCKYYNQEKDYCSSYMMGVYTGLAFEVSRHKTCIKDLVEKDD